jgi:hypothetical protein
LPYVKGNGWEIYDDDYEPYDDWEIYDDDLEFPTIQEGKTTYGAPPPNSGGPVIYGPSLSLYSPGSYPGTEGSIPYGYSSPSAVETYGLSYPGSYYEVPGYVSNVPVGNTLYNMAPYGYGSPGLGPYGANPYVNAAPVTPGAYGLSPYANGSFPGGNVYPYGVPGYGGSGWYGGIGGFGGFGWWWPLIILGLLLAGGYYLFSRGFFNW